MALLRLGYRAAWWALRAWTFATRPHVRGTMVVVRDAAGRVLLARHTYGPRGMWDLPGGWVHAGEDPAHAARREAHEELGIAIDPRPLAVLNRRIDFKREELAAFVADWPGGRGHYDPVEIAELGWFAPGALPDRVGAGTRDVLARLG